MKKPDLTALLDWFSRQLHPKPTPKDHPKYATLNARMTASTIDSILAIFTLSPLADWAVAPLMSAPAQELGLEQLQQLADPQMADAFMQQWVMTSGPDWMMSFMAQSVALLLASGLCWKFWSATPGKLMMGMKVLDAATEQPLSNKQIILRCLGYIPSCGSFALGIFWIGWDKKHQGWHDKIAGTVVTRKTKVSPAAQEHSAV